VEGLVLKRALQTTSLFVILFGGVIQAKDDGFNGKWVLDHHETQPNDCPKKLETAIKQDGSAITLENRFQEPDTGVVPLLYLGVLTTKLHLSSDGQSQENTIGPFQMSSKSKVDGKEIKTEWTAILEGGQLQGQWTHRLSDDGKHLTWEIKQTPADGGQERQVILYFVRK
jgi:hypothetical protein